MEHSKWIFPFIALISIGIFVFLSYMVYTKRLRLRWAFLIGIPYLLFVLFIGFIGYRVLYPEVVRIEVEERHSAAGLVQVGTANPEAMLKALKGKTVVVNKLYNSGSSVIKGRKIYLFTASPGTETFDRVVFAGLPADIETETTLSALTPITPVDLAVRFTGFETIGGDKDKVYVFLFSVLRAHPKS